jgi:hypothetical protein
LTTNTHPPILLYLQEEAAVFRPCDPLRRRHDSSLAVSSTVTFPSGFCETVAVREAARQSGEGADDGVPDLCTCAGGAPAGVPDLL